jgi:hypothetical protein
LEVRVQVEGAKGSLIKVEGWNPKQRQRPKETKVEPLVVVKVDLMPGYKEVIRWRDDG